MANKISDETIEYVGILQSWIFLMKRRRRPRRTWDECWIILIC